MKAKAKNQLLKASKATKENVIGQVITFLCATIIVTLTLAIIFFVASRGIRAFVVDHISLGQFLTGSEWNPGTKNAQGQPIAGSLPMIIGSFGVTLLAALIATPFSLVIGIYMTEYASKRMRRLIQPMIELFTGVPSVVYGFTGLMVIVPITRKLFGGTGFGILPGALVLFVMILPTITSMVVDTLQRIPVSFRQAALALGATKWQSIYLIVLRASIPGILTAIIFGMARAFGEALAVQMVIGNSPLLPTNLVSPTATLTSQLTSQIGNTIMNSVENDALWALALVLLLMSLVFNLVAKWIGKRGELK